MPVLRANQIDHAAPVAMIKIAVIGDTIFVPNRVAKSDVEPVD